MDRKLLVAAGLIVALVAAFAIWRFAAEDRQTDFESGTDGTTIGAEKQEPVVAPRRESGPTVPEVELERGDETEIEGGRLEGRVVLGDDGPAAPGARVVIHLLGHDPLAETICDEDGRFAIPAPAGEEDLVLRAEHEGLVSREIVDLELEIDESRDLGTIVLGPAIEIRGSVRDARGKAIAGARLQLLPNLPMSGLSVESVKKMIDALLIDDEGLDERISDEKGEFVFARVAAGTYALIATAEGCATGYSPRLTLHPGQAREEVDFVLPPGCSLRGRVTDAEGRGIAGALIAVLPTGNDFPSLFRTLKTDTDANGGYELSALPQGRLMVLCRKEGLAPFGDDVRVEDRTTLDIRLTSGWRLRGVVLEATSGRPIVGVEIAVISNNSLNIPRAETDVEGKFDFPHVPDDKLAGIVVHKEGLQIVDDGRMRVMNGPFSIIDPRKDENGKYPDYIEIRMTGGGRIEGRVVDADSGAGIAGARVYSMGSGDTELAIFSAGGGVITDKDGNFVLEGVTAGPYLLNASARGFYTAEPVTRDRLRGRDGSPSIIDAGQTVVAAVVKLRRGVVQRGRVLDPEGKALPGARVDWQPTTEGQGSFEMMMMMMGSSFDQVISDDEGRFSIDGLRPGVAVTVEAEHPDFMGGGIAEIAAEALGVEEIAIRVSTGGRVEGQLRIEGGGNPEGMVVTMRRQERRRNPFESRKDNEMQTACDSQGRFVFDGLATSEYWFTIESSTDFRAPRARSSVAVRGGEATALVIDLFRNWKIEGRVVDEGGKPFPDCQVRVDAIDPDGLIEAERDQPEHRDRGRSRAWSRTGENGHFLVTELDGRFDYEIRVQGPRDRESKEPRLETMIERVKVATEGLRITLTRP